MRSTTQAQISPSQSEPLEKLMSDGYLLLRGFASSALMDEIEAFCGNALNDAENSAKGSKVRSLGSLLRVNSDLRATPLLLREQTLANLEALGLEDLKFHDSVVFRKPADSPPTFWHQDYSFWSDPLSQQPYPHHFTCLWYTQDTTEENGALRVIPGTHLHRHPLHDFWDFKNDEERLATRADLRAAKDLNSPAFRSYPEQEILSVKRGDVVVLDSRTLHGACPNSSGSDRTALSTWYVSGFDKFSEGMQALLSEQYGDSYRKWPAELIERHRNRLPIYEGSALPADAVALAKPRFSD